MSDDFIPVHGHVIDSGGGRFTVGVADDTYEYPSGEVTTIPSHRWGPLLADQERTVNLAGHSILMEFHVERLRRFEQNPLAETQRWSHPALRRAWQDAVFDVSACSDPGRKRAALVVLGALCEMWVQAIDAAATERTPGAVESRETPSGGTGEPGIV